MCMCIILHELTGILDQNLWCYDSCICRQLACSLAYLRAVGGDSVCSGGSKVACMLQQCLLYIKRLTYVFLPQYITSFVRAK